jgi:hypothetical protein
LGAIKARVAAGGLLALLIWQAGVAVSAEWGRFSPSLTAASLSADSEARYRATIGAHHDLLAAVWAHAPDIQRLIVVRDRAAAPARAPGPPDGAIDRTVPKDMLIAHLTTLLFPVVVQDLPGLVSGAATLAELLEPTTYVLDLRPDGALAELPALRSITSGGGFELLRYDPLW